MCLAGGESLSADLVVLATGAWTGKLVDLRNRALATGQAMAYIELSGEEQTALQDMPTLLNFATGIFIIPPRGRLLKIARHAYGYINPMNVPVPGPEEKGKDMMEISLPRTDTPVPSEGVAAFRSALSALLPSFKNRPFVKTRVCWYTDT